jgi:hypothetical protein
LLGTLCSDTPPFTPIYKWQTFSVEGFFPVDGAGRPKLYLFYRYSVVLPNGNAENAPQAAIQECTREGKLQSAKDKD